MQAKRPILLCWLQRAHRNWQKRQLAASRAQFVAAIARSPHRKPLASLVRRRRGQIADRSAWPVNNNKSACRVLDSWTREASAGLFSRFLRLVGHSRRAAFLFNRDTSEPCPFSVPSQSAEHRSPCLGAESLLRDALRRACCCCDARLPRRGRR